MGSGWSELSADVEDAGKVLHKTILEIEDRTASVAKNVIDCTRSVAGFIVELGKLLLCEEDHDSRVLLERLNDALRCLKYCAEGVLRSCRALAVTAANEALLGRIKDELKQRGMLERAWVYIRNTFSREQGQSSALKEFLDLVHGRTLECTKAVNEFYSQYKTSLGVLRRAIDVKKKELATCKRIVEKSAIINTMSKKVAIGGWVTCVVCCTVGAVACVATGGAAAPGIMSLARAGAVASVLTGAGGIAATVVSENLLHSARHRCEYLESVQKRILNMQKEVNVIKSSIKEMDVHIQNAKDVVTLLSSCQHESRYSIGVSLDELRDCMRDLIHTIESREWQHE